jgi:hypothetical protein
MTDEPTKELRLAPVETAEPQLALPSKEPKGCQLEVQREFMPLFNIEPYDEEQKIFRGQLIPTARRGQWSKISDRDWIYFSRRYDAEHNDLDKVFIEEEYDASLTGYSFTLIPGNKVRMFYVPESSIIQLAAGGSVLT